MFAFRVIGFLLYKPQAPTASDEFKTQDVTLIIPTIDTDEEAMHEAMRSWVLNEPAEIIIVTVGETTQKELQRIASTSIAADITRVLRVDGAANKRIQLVHGVRRTASVAGWPSSHGAKRLARAPDVAMTPPQPRETQRSTMRIARRHQRRGDAAHLLH